MRATSVAPVVNLVMGTDFGASAHPSSVDLDLYELSADHLAAARGLLIGGNADQVFLERHRDLLAGFAGTGGRIAVMGHAVTNFLPGLGVWRPLSHSGSADLQIVAGADHPVWAGVDRADISHRRGVSGFYARGYSDTLPDGARVTNRIGRHELPVDYVYPIGAGEVLVHGGLDLAVFGDDPNTGSRMFPQLLRWLGGTPEPGVPEPTRHTRK
ncbi:MAG: hypothetical protein WAX14_07605 [Rhodococcus sp. (in: high G+C Gram-positive bacteria)]|uniref:hypothetical protein n=1 Tax=Rhodococcus sp. TaxID=1831 RepID=UPI003BB7C62F